MIFTLLMTALSAYVCLYIVHRLTKRSSGFKEFMRSKARTHLEKGIRILEYRGGLSGMVEYVKLSTDQKQLLEYILIAMTTKISYEVTKERILSDFEKTSVIRFSILGTIRTAAGSQALEQVFELLKASFHEMWSTIPVSPIIPPSQFDYRFMIGPLGKMTYTVHADIPYEETSMSYEYAIHFVIYVE